ncbi:MAG: Yip1 family protein [Halobacteriota archaeon]|nr:Yip1 family protein [Halobacteriota archaeon]
MDANSIQDDLRSTIKKGIKIVREPRTAMEEFKAEDIGVNDLIMKYVAFLAIIPLIGSIIGGLFTSFGLGVATGVIGFIMNIISVVIFGFVIDFLASSFSSKQNRDQATKLAACVATPSLLAGILYAIPPLSPLILLAALYGLYILYLGIPIFMETPQQQVLIYTIVAIVANLILYAIFGAIVAGIIGALFVGSMIGSGTMPGGYGF